MLHIQYILNVMGKWRSVLIFNYRQKATLYKQFINKTVQGQWAR